MREATFCSLVVTLSIFTVKLDRRTLLGGAAVYISPSVIFGVLYPDSLPLGALFLKFSTSILIEDSVTVCKGNQKVRHPNLATTCTVMLNHIFWEMYIFLHLWSMDNNSMHHKRLTTIHESTRQYLI